MATSQWDAIAMTLGATGWRGNDGLIRSVMVSSRPDGRIDDAMVTHCSWILGFWPSVAFYHSGSSSFMTQSGLTKPTGSPIFNQKLPSWTGSLLFYCITDLLSNLDQLVGRFTGLTNRSKLIFTTLTTGIKTQLQRMQDLNTYWKGNNVICTYF